MLRWLSALTVIAACGGKEGCARRADLADVRTRLAAYEACLSGNRAGDFSEAVALTLPAEPEVLACAETIRAPLLPKLVQLAARLGVDRPTDAPFAPANRASGDAVCRDLRRLVGPANEVAVKLGADEVTMPSCHLAR